MPDASLSSTGGSTESPRNKPSTPSAPAEQVSKGQAQGWPVINYALKAKYAAYTTLVFFLIANPETYKMIQKAVGKVVTVASEGGCPTPTGFFLQTGLFFLVLWGFMLFPRDF
jgi:hypothetical protein